MHSADPTANCIRCGYSLRGLGLEDRCPECGLSVRTSVRDDYLGHADPNYVGMVALGARLWAWTTPIVWLTSASQMVQLGGGWWTAPALAVYGGVEAAWLGSCWLIASPDPAQWQRAQMESVIVRAPVVAVALLKCAALAVWAWGGWYPVTGPLPLLTMAAGAAAYAGTLRHVASLIQRCRGPRPVSLRGYYAAGAAIFVVAALWGSGIGFVPDAHGALLAAAAMPFFFAAVLAYTALEVPSQSAGALAALGVGVAVTALHVKLVLLLARAQRRLTRAKRDGKGLGILG